ncbi:MAG TPA: DUF1015 domain-containing protein [Bryobacteraceae bacterium]|nr:DUF1015 domain-containing protein [Bryobacteraceae bacterium]
MAQIFPFQPFRYSEKAGPLGLVVTQPYDKISGEMRTRYLAQSPYNLVRVILGERYDSDTETDNVYTRAARYLEEWIGQGILAQEQEPSLYAYFQEFQVPDTGETVVRKGFVGLGALEDYSAGVVHRHEQTLSGPKKDRLELLRHTHAHFGQIFMLYPDPAGEIDALLEESAQIPPLGAVTDEYGAVHRFWKIADTARIERIRQCMAPKKLLIADGHHRYETALAFRNENPGLAGADKTMMTFVNMHSPGLRILATHRLVHSMEDFVPAAFLAKAAAHFRVEEIGGPDMLRRAWRDSTNTVIGAASGERLYLLEWLGAPGELDVRVLHDVLLSRVLGIGEEAVREERNLRYVRGLEAALEAAREGQAQIAFLLKATSIQQVAEISFAGGVMPQKSTDFYPKLLSGLTVYRLA